MSEKLAARLLSLDGPALLRVLESAMAVVDLTAAAVARGTTCSETMADFDEIREALAAYHATRAKEVGDG